MSFGSLIKRALGFGGEREEDFDDIDDLQYEPESPAVPAAADCVGDTTEAVAGELFSAVVDMFNRWQPQFVRDCISTDAQRRFLYNSLSAELRKRLDAGVTAESETAPDDRRRMQTEIDRLNYELKKTDGLRNTLEQTRLSAERQKRALSDRVLDLTRQVADLEEKNEKYILAGASGAARGSAAEVERLNGEVERLTTLNEQLDTKARMADTMLSELKTKLSESKKENERLTAQVAEVDEIHRQLDKVEQVIARKDASIAELNERIAALQTDADKYAAMENKVAKLKAERENLRKTIENNLYNQARSEMALRKEIKALEKRLGVTADGDADAARKPRRRRKAEGEGAADTASEPDFGYKAPPRTRHNDDEAQMSLF